MARTVGSEDNRLRKRDGEAAQRGNPAAAQDRDRVMEDGTAMSMEDRRRQIRNEWQQSVLPTPPEIPGFHTCWLSTTHPTDTVHRRLKLGYALVRKDEVENFEVERGVQSGTSQYSDYVTCNEMVLAKIPSEIYQVAMAEFHHYQPRDEERAIRERMGQNASQINEEAGRNVVTTEGDGFNKLGNLPETPPVFSD